MGLTRVLGCRLWLWLVPIVLLLQLRLLLLLLLLLRLSAVLWPRRTRLAWVRVNVVITAAQRQEIPRHGSVA